MSGYKLIFVTTIVEFPPVDIVVVPVFVESETVDVNVLFSDCTLPLPFSSTGTPDGQLKFKGEPSTFVILFPLVSNMTFL